MYARDLHITNNGDLIIQRDPFKLSSPLWKVLNYTRSYGGNCGDTLDVPPDARQAIEVYLSAGTGPDAVGSTIPLEVWLIQMEIITSRQLLFHFNAMHMNAIIELFKSPLSREIWLRGLPPVHADRASYPEVDPAISMTSDGGINANSIIIEALAGSIINTTLTKYDFVPYHSFNEFLGSKSRVSALEQVVSTSLRLLAERWGHITSEQQAIDHRWAKYLFEAIGRKTAWL